MENITTKNTWFCQSCGMPMDNEELFGTDKGGGKNSDYCAYCYKDGEFTDGISSLDEYIEYSARWAEQAGMSEEEMKAHCRAVLPTLKRWKTS